MNEVPQNYDSNRFQKIAFSQQRFHVIEYGLLLKKTPQLQLLVPTVYHCDGDLANRKQHFGNWLKALYRSQAVVLSSDALRKLFAMTYICDLITRHSPCQLHLISEGFTEISSCLNNFSCKIYFNERQVDNCLLLLIIV